MATISPRLSLPAAHEYVRAPADMHPRLVGLTSPNSTITGLNSREPQASAGLTGGNPTFRTHGMIRPAQVVAARWTSLLVGPRVRQQCLRSKAPDAD